jgi:CHAT domain-containing protein
VVANPDYGQATSRTAPVAPSLNVTFPPELDRSGLTFLPLDGVAAEGIALGFLLELDDTHVLIGNKATETRLKGLHGPKILHLATHGFFFPNEEIAERSILPAATDPASLVRMLAKNPLLHSGLALAGVNTRGSGQKDDGILTAAEFARLDLAGTQLVVISACDTGLGEIQQGEGVNGLRRAVMLAGAETQVVSLWKVNDEATKLLMVDYYGRLYKGEGRSGALHSVQLKMMENPMYQHPFFWAAFIPIGDWKPLY